MLQQVDHQRKVQGGKAKSSSLLCILKLSKAQLNIKAYRVSDFVCGIFKIFLLRFSDSCR